MPLLSSSSWQWSIQYEHRQKAKDESKEEKKGKSRKNAQPKLSETNRRKIRFVSRKQKIICISPNLAFQNDKKNFFVCAHRNECSCSSPAQRSVRKRKGKKETESEKERKRERESERDEENAGPLPETKKTGILFVSYPKNCPWIYIKYKFSQRRINTSMWNIYGHKFKEV